MVCELASLTYQQYVNEGNGIMTTTTITSIYPVLQVDDVAAEHRFFAEAFGLETTFEADWYVSLRAPGDGGFELALLAADHETIPDGHRGASTSVLVNIEVDDVDAVHDRLVGLGVPVAKPLRSQDFGQRHVIVASPSGVLVDVITPIEPSPESAAAFGGE